MKVSIKDLFITDKFADIVVTEDTKKVNLHVVFRPDNDIDFYEGEVHSHRSLDRDIFDNTTWWEIYNWVDRNVEALQW